VGPVLRIRVIAGDRYYLTRHDHKVAEEKFAPVSGLPASNVKTLGPVQIGLATR
jgi:hypothetical protein